MLSIGVKRLMRRSGSDNEIRACILLQLQELYQGLTFYPGCKYVYPTQFITLLIQKTKTRVFVKIFSWPCRGHLVYIT